MPAIKEVGPGRLEIREGGGCLTLFGLPFFATGIFATLSSFGVVTMRSDGQPATQAATVVIAGLFTVVGAVLSFGRSVTAVDVGQQIITKQWRIVLPVRAWTYQLGQYTAVTLSFVRGDSDSADRYPIGLKGNGVAPLPLCSSTSFAEARRCATAVARHLGLDIEDTSTDHPARMTASEADTSLQERLRSTASAPAVARPPVMTSDLSDEGGVVRVAIPRSPLSPWGVVAGFVPAVVAITMLRWLGILSGPRPLAPAEWVFVGVLSIGFGVLPAAGAVLRWIRSRRGQTIVTVSALELHVQEHGIFRTRTIALWPAPDILDVDYSSKESALASSRQHAEVQTATMRRIPISSATAGARTERVFAVLSRFVKGTGLIVKTRTGLTTFGEGLADDELRYLHAVVRRALAETVDDRRAPDDPR
jgi:hypothetical protein